MGQKCSLRWADFIVGSFKWRWEIWRLSDLGWTGWRLTDKSGAGIHYSEIQFQGLYFIHGRLSFKDRKWSPSSGTSQVRDRTPVISKMIDIGKWKANAKLSMLNTIKMLKIDSMLSRSHLNWGVFMLFLLFVSPGVISDLVEVSEQ